MTEVPHYREQPATLDDRTEIPEGAPLAQGHSEESAADVREASEQNRADAEAEAEEDESASDAGASDASESEVPNGTVAEVQAWVGEDPDRAAQALDAEAAGQNRATLVAWLEARL